MISAMKESDWFDNVSGLRHSGAETHLSLEIMFTNKALLGAFSRETGLPMSQLALLRVLAGAPRGGIGVLDIARRLGINGAAITRLVRKMEDRGLAIRRADKHDGRRSNLKLSAKGRALFRKVHQRLHEFDDLLGADLEPEDIAAVKRVLAHLRTVLEKVY